MSRFGYKWNINECLRLQREFELLCLTIDEIAALHKRTPKAIMFKLDEEGFATYTDLYNGYHGLNKNTVDYPLDQVSKLDYDTDTASDTCDSEALSVGDVSDVGDESDVGSYYNMRNYIKQLETQVSGLSDYIKVNIKPTV